MKGARKVTLEGVALLLRILKNLGLETPQVTLVFRLLFFLVLLVPSWQNVCLVPKIRPGLLTSTTHKSSYLTPQRLS